MHAAASHTIGRALRLTWGFVFCGHSSWSSRTAVYNPPKPPPRMHTRGAGRAPVPAVKLQVKFTSHDFAVHGMPLATQAAVPLSQRMHLVPQVCTEAAVVC
jgi:hypothetical protein